MAPGSGEMGQAPRAVGQVGARAALDDPAADLGEPFRVRQALARFGPGLPGRRRTQERSRVVCPWGRYRDDCVLIMPSHRAVRGATVVRLGRFVA